MDYSLANVAYIGDDVLDLQCMNAIKEHGGIVGCPVDAAKSVLNISDFVSSIHSLAKTGHVSGLYFYGLLVSFILS